MKTLIKFLPAWLKVMLYFAVLALAMLTAGTIPPLNDFWFFLLVAALLSWLFLWTEERSILSLHFIPEKPQHWLQLGGGVLTGCCMLMVTAVATIGLTGDSWYFHAVDPIFILVTLLACWWSAFVQEFVFRGYPFQKLVACYGPGIAQLLIAIPFGLMHLHSGMSMKECLLTMLTTGLGSVLFGIAYLRTGHLALPVGLHLGWNFAQALIPRTVGTAENTLIVLKGNAANYTTVDTLVPYLVIMLVVSLCPGILPGRKTKNPPSVIAANNPLT